MGEFKVSSCSHNHSTVFTFDHFGSVQTFQLFVDANDHAVDDILTQADKTGDQQPIAFASGKLNRTQQAWSTVKKVLCRFMGLEYRNWVFGAEIVVHSHHNLLT